MQHPECHCQKHFFVQLTELDDFQLFFLPVIDTVPLWLSSVCCLPVGDDSCYLIIFSCYSDKNSFKSLHFNDKKKKYFYCVCVCVCVVALFTVGDLFCVQVGAIIFLFPLWRDGAIHTATAGQQSCLFPVTHCCYTEMEHCHNNNRSIIISQVCSPLRHL